MTTNLRPGIPSKPSSLARSLVALPGATLSALLRSAEFTPLEWLWSAEPNEAWYDPSRSPANPTQFEIGSKKVPSGSTVVVLDFSFEPYRFSEVGAHEWQPVTRNSLRGSLGYQFKVAGKTPGSVEFYIDPKNSTGEPEEFLVDKVQLWTTSTPKAADFNRARASAVGTAAGVGTAMLPQRTGRYGADFAPFAIPATDDQTITLRGIVYRPISVGLACVEGRVMGYVGSTAILQKHLADMENVVR